MVIFIPTFCYPSQMAASLLSCLLALLILSHLKHMTASPTLPDVTTSQIFDVFSIHINCILHQCRVIMHSTSCGQILESRTFWSGFLPKQSARLLLLGFGSHLILWWKEHLENVAFGMASRGVFLSCEPESLFGILKQFTKSTAY